MQHRSTIEGMAMPKFPKVSWLNVEVPPTIQELRGKIVLLDFWTYGCINCIHIASVLRRLEKKYPSELVVIGVHSAKFKNEGDINNLSQVIRRYDIRHPVINDKDFLVWDMYNIPAWPTLVVVDPKGTIIHTQSGEIPFETLDQMIKELIELYNIPSTNDLTSNTTSFVVDQIIPPDTLSFPGKVLADPIGKRLFISDTGNNRLVIADIRDFTILNIIGTGKPILQDGTYEQSAFNRPQGMVLSPNGDTLYVADTSNHSIRMVDLFAHKVSTIAGSGKIGYSFIPQSPDPRKVDLRSPWDLELDGDILYIAMAGMHQIWQLSLTTNVIMPIVGSGYEGLEDGSLQRSDLAQPSGLFLKDNLLYFADSESSTIRVADLKSNKVSRISGTPSNSLFDFGDKDGSIGRSRLQHPLGVTGTSSGDALFIADTYNHRIKVIDVQSRVTQTLSGVGRGGSLDGPLNTAMFNEPGGLDFADGKVYVADTNNSAIRVIDLTTQQVISIHFSSEGEVDLQKYAISSQKQKNLAIFPEQSISPGVVEVNLDILLNDGYKLNPLASSMLTWNTDSHSQELKSIPIESLKVQFPLILQSGHTDLKLYLDFYYCTIDGILCYLHNAEFWVPLTVSTLAQQNKIFIQHTISTNRT